jgi:hypothetical protein
MTDIPEDIMNAAEEALDNLLCNCVESCGGAAGLRQSSITDIAKALLAERQRSEWQPIETAPKVESDRVLVAWPNSKWWVCIGFWSGNYHGLNAWADDNTENELVPQPTHWMPLPEAPKGGEA